MRACWLKWVGRDWSISADYIWLNYSDANTASSSALATPRQHPTSISHAAWYMATAVAAYLARKTEEKMLAHAAPQLPGAGLAHAVAHRC